MMVLGTVGTQAQVQNLSKKPLYNAAKDFQPVALLAEVPLVLIVRKDLPVEQHQGIRRVHQGEPGQDAVRAPPASARRCISARVLLNSAIGVNVTHVPYRGSAPAMQDLQGGRVDYMTEIVSTAFPQIQGNAVKAIAALAPQRIKNLPDLPTAREGGVNVDLMRFLATLLLLTLLLGLGAIATQTTDSVDEELSGAVALLPGPLLFIVNLIVGFGFLGVPIAIGIDLILRRRGRQLLEALLTVAVAILVIAGLDAILLNADGAARLLAALTQPEGATNPFSALVAGVIAYYVVARVGERHLWIVASWVVVTAFLVTSLLARQHTLLSLTSSLLIGLAVGQGMRYGLGTTASRPSGRRIAIALVRAGVPLARLERVVPDKRDGRRYVATRPDGSLVDVTVLDRDQEGAGLGYRAWRLLRVRGPAAGRTYVSVRRSLEHEALLAYAAAAAGARTPALVATSEVGAYAALLAFEHIEGRPLSELSPEEVTDEVLADAWEQLAALRAARVAHRGFTSDNLMVSPGGRVHLLAVRSGEVAATDLALRIDVAQLLTALALVAGPERAVRTGALRLGTEPLAEALPVLQPLALSLTTRQEVRHDKTLLHELRAAVLDALPRGVEVPTEDVRLERLPLRTLFLIVGGSIAGYIVLSQLSDVDLANLMATADWRWAGVALVFSVLTYVGAAFSLTGFVLKSISWFRAFLAQVAASFVSLVAPPAVGGIALNARFLQKAGVDPSVAVATVGVWQAMAFVVHIVMLVLFGVIAGTRAETSFDPPQGAILGGCRC